MKTASTAIAILALALIAPLCAQAETPSARKAQKVHAVSLSSSITAAKVAKPAAKEKAVKMRMAQEPEATEPVYDYASCGCS